MPVELKVPEFGESVTEVQIANWLRQEGDRIERDEDLVELESDKAALELSAPAGGVLTKILKPAGETARIGEVLALIETQEAAAKISPSKSASPTKSAEPAAAKPAASPVQDRPSAPTAVAKAPATPVQVAPRRPVTSISSEDIEVIPMTLLRRRIAERLVAAQQQAALLTTYNEVDMSAVKELRERMGPAFKERHGIKLGFMSFFVKAVVDALRAFPILNSEIRGNDILRHRRIHMGVAIGSERGLVVPILKDADAMHFAEIEQAIADFSRRAGDGTLLPDELQGGTFTISNGGVYGSLLSTPIVNPPQSGILGMHAIQDRPVAREGQVVIRPMMYLALTYDHRLVDGREAVTFLKHIKDVVEDPARLLFGV